MEQSNLVELIKALSPEEREQALQFATLSFLNQGKMRAFVGPLLELCLRHPWENAAQTLEKKRGFCPNLSGSALCGRQTGIGNGRGEQIGPKLSFRTTLPEGRQ